MINSIPLIQPNAQTTVLPTDTFPGQKLDKSQEIPQLVVGRKDETPSAKEDTPREEVEKAAEKLNRLMGIIEKRWKYSIDDSTHRVVVKVIDKDTGEVLNEIPPKKILDLIASFTKQTGLLADKKV